MPYEDLQTAWKQMNKEEQKKKTKLKFQKKKNTKKTETQKHNLHMAILLCICRDERQRKESCFIVYIEGIYASSYAKV